MEKSVYIVSIIDAKNVMVSWKILAKGMAEAIAGAQSKAGVTHDPTTFQLSSHIDFEV